MAKSKNNKFVKSNWNSDDFEDNKFNKKKNLKNKAMYEEDFKDELDNYYDDDLDGLSSDLYEDDLDDDDFDNDQYDYDDDDDDE